LLPLQAAYGASLPVPLNYWLPWSQRRTVAKRFAQASADKVSSATALKFVDAQGRVPARSFEWVCVLSGAKACSCPHRCRQVYQEAATAYNAIAERLKSNSSTSSSRADAGFFFGEKPSSLDAYLFGHLLYQRSAPVSAPELHGKVIRRRLGA
jgi:Glutathione S-transferase, C-terminal domain